MMWCSVILILLNCLKSIYDFICQLQSVLLVIVLLLLPVMKAKLVIISYVYLQIIIMYLLNLVKGFAFDLSCTVQLISNFMLVNTESWVSAYFSCALYWNLQVQLLNSCVYHWTHMFKFVDRHGFISVLSSSNSSGMHCKYVRSSDSLLCVHTSSLCALLEQ